MDLNEAKKALKTLEALRGDEPAPPHSSLVQFVSINPDMEGFRSHRKYFGPALTRLRFFSFKFILWVAYPIRLSLIAQAMEIERLQKEVKRLQDRLA